MIHDCPVKLHKPNKKTKLTCLQISIIQPIRVEDVVIVKDEWGRIEADPAHLNSSL
jgi:hypothetical protein